MSKYPPIANLRSEDFATQQEALAAWPVITITDDQTGCCKYCKDRPKLEWRIANVADPRIRDQMDKTAAEVCPSCLRFHNWVSVKHRFLPASQLVQ